MIKRNMPKILTNAVIINVTWVSGAYAYFDYGTGSLLIQSLIAGLGMVALGFNRIKYYVSFLMRKIFLRKKSNVFSLEKEIENNNNNRFNDTDVS